MAKKVRFVSSQLKSKSLRLLAQVLSEQLGYKVWRGPTSKPNRIEFKYGECKDKLTQYKFFQAKGIPAPEFTTSAEQAKQWLANENTVIARTLLNSSEGKGIVVLEAASSFVSAPVYTKYLKKKREFRVHVFKDQVVSVLEKRKKKGATSEETKIRNTANGYVFCRENVTEPPGIRELALKASKVTNSDFRGVDIGYNEKKDQLFVIEVNSAPGMEGSTITEYAQEIIKHVQG